MHGSRIAFYFVGLAVLGCCAFAAAGWQKVKVKNPRPLAAKLAYATVQPIFAKNCVMCHSGPRPKHGLDLTSYPSLMKGDPEGKVIIPGNPGQSRLSHAIHRKGATPMPPMGPIAAGDVGKIDAWIKAGAKSK